MTERPDIVLVAFEGPDRYSFVGGLATRMNDLAEALVERGHRVRHVFVGDPALPSTEPRLDGRLLLERWCQRISLYHPKDVYDGEDGKRADFSRTVPPHLVDDVVASAAREGRRTVILFEDWQTADAAIATAALLGARGLRGWASLFWNANNTYGFAEVDFPALDRAVAITTVSRFMRAQMTGIGVDPQIHPNGIAERYLRPLPPSEARVLRTAFGDRPTFVKVARFDPDKRWLWAVDAIAALRDGGMRPRLVMRGSGADYAAVVGERIRARRLSVERVALSAEGPTAKQQAAGAPAPSPTAKQQAAGAPAPSPTKDLAAALSATAADVVFLDFFVAERTIRALYAAADGVLANSEKEPFGLVGLEVMASGGIAYVGRTGEDYAVPYGNAVVVQTDDPRELSTHLGTLRADPALAERIRAEGRATAKRFAWPRIIDGLEIAWDAAARMGK